MSAIHQTRWMCDRCGIDTVEEYRKQPVNWVRLVQVAPPEATDDNDNVESRDLLCPKCRDAFRQWRCEG